MAKNSETFQDDTEGSEMEKTVTITGKMIESSPGATMEGARAGKERRDHLQIWREIYQEVRRQWAEAEMERTGRYR